LWRSEWAWDTLNLGNPVSWLVVIVAVIALSIPLLLVP
jgi:uncharacterized membrane protein